MDFILDGHMLDTTSTCTESEITSIVEACTINITSPTVQITIDGTKDVDDRIKIKVGRDKAAVDAETAGPDQNNFPSDGSSANLSFQPGRNLLSVWGDEDGSGSTAPTEHFFRINLVPYWELNGEHSVKRQRLPGHRSTTPRLWTRSPMPTVSSPHSSEIPPNSGSST